MLSVSCGLSSCLATYPIMHLLSFSLGVSICVCISVCPTALMSILSSCPYVSRSACVFLRLYISLSYRWSIYNCIVNVFDALECRFGLGHRACLTSTGTMNITPSAGSSTCHPGKPRCSSTCRRIRAINPLKAASPDNSQSPTERNSFTTLHILLSSRYWIHKDFTVTDSRRK